MELLESVGMIGGAEEPTAVFVAGILNAQALVVSIVIGIVLCLFGLKMMRVLSAIVGLFIGAGIGAGIVLAFQLDGTVALAVILGCALVMAVLSFFLKRAGAFFSVLCYGFGALLVVLPKESVLFVAVAGVVALVLAILAAIYMEPLIVVVSSISGGLMAGPAIITLVGLKEKMWIGYIAAVILAVIGVLLQLLMQSGKIKKKDKIHSQKVKEEDSMESEVEKARHLLGNEDDIEETVNNEEELEIIEEDL